MAIVFLFCFVKFHPRRDIHSAVKLRFLVNLVLKNRAADMRAVIKDSLIGEPSSIPCQLPHATGL